MLKCVGDAKSAQPQASGIEYIRSLRFYFGSLSLRF